MTAHAERQCFVCDEGTPRERERPWEWAAPRVLCEGHDCDLRLSDGQPLREVLAAVAMASCKRPQGDLASVAALGDSITARFRLSYSYPDRLGRWRQIPVRNFGVPGDTTAQMLDRLADVLDSGPTPQVVVILGGTHDIARGMRAEETLHNLQTIAERIRDSGRRPVLVCPPPSGAFHFDRARARVARASARLIPDRPDAGRYSPRSAIAGLTRVARRAGK
jgi:hypothetical protein